MAVDRKKAALLYYQMIQQGIPPQQAFARAFPDGIPTAEDEAREAAKEQQSQGLGAIGGTVAGALGTKAVFDAVTNEPILGGIFDSAAPAAAGEGGGILSSLFGGGEAAAAGTEAAAPAVEAAAEGLGGAGASTGGLGSYAIPGIGAALGAYGLHNAYKSGNPIMGALSGAGLGGSAAALMGFSPWGLPVLAGGALLGALTGSLKGKTTKEIQADRWGGTGASQGIIDQMGGGAHDYFAGTGGEQNRDERFLTADAIRHNPDNYNNVSDWEQWDRGKQDTFLNALLGEGKVEERKGGIYYDDARAQELAGQIRGGTFGQPQQAPKPYMTQLTPEELAANKRFGSQLIGRLG